MRYPEYIREKAVALRRDRDLGIDEIAQRLAIPRTTIYHWVKDMPLREPRTERRRLAQLRSGEASRLKHARLRADAYARGHHEWARLESEPTFREFVALYIAEGYKRNRNVVSIATRTQAC